MGLFRGSDGGSSSTSPQHPDTQQMPTRSSRQECWNARDQYYACLKSKEIIIPPGTDMSDPRGPAGKPTAEDKAKMEARAQRLQSELDADPCLDLRKGFEKDCARSWIDYFNKRRVLEERQRLMYAQGAPLGSGPAPGNRQ